MGVKETLIEWYVSESEDRMADIVKQAKKKMTKKETTILVEQIVEETTARYIQIMRINILTYSQISELMGIPIDKVRELSFKYQ